MIALLKKELDLFLNTLIGYLAIGVFLLGVGSIIWVFPDTNILDYGFASLDPLFTLGPYLFMFLIPAITMRSYAEEQRNGTLELLYTLPFRLWHILLAKYLASVLMVLFSLLFTLPYFYTVYQLGNPVGNLDISGIMGSYLGLFLLGSVFTAVGLFASAITGNQIVSFLLAVFFCFLLYEGFDLLASIDQWSNWAYVVGQLGISSHYNAMGKGLLDFRDVAYFAGVIFLFLYGTRLTTSIK